MPSVFKLGNQRLVSLSQIKQSKYWIVLRGSIPELLSSYHQHPLKLPPPSSIHLPSWIPSMDVQKQVVSPFESSNSVCLSRVKQNMCAMTLCKLQTARQHIIIMLVNYTHKDTFNRNETAAVDNCRICSLQQIFDGSLRSKQLKV